MSKDTGMSKAQSCTRTNKDTVDVMGSSTETKHIAQGGGESLDGRHRAGGPAVVQQQVGSSAMQSGMGGKGQL